MMAMMSHNMKEKEESQMKLDHTDEVVKHFVDYFYTGSVPPEILMENIGKYLELADSYNLKPLMRQTEEIAIEELDCKNMVDMLVLADFYRAESLRESAEFLITVNKDLLRDQDLSEVPANVCAAIVKLIC